MTQIDQMTNAEIDERFRVSGAKPVAFLLGGYAKTREAFSVHFNHGEDMFLTTLLEVQAEKGRLVFDCSGSAESNRRIVLSDKVTFGGNPGGVPVHFSTGMVNETTFEGGKAFSVALPEYVIRLQRRENFRIETPRVNPLVLFARLPNGQLIKLPVHDISVGGIGVDAPELPEGLDLGVTMPNCHFSLPGDNKDLFFSATVRNYHQYESRTGHRMYRIGFQFNDLSTSDENRIQRYIAKVERERHELS